MNEGRTIRLTEYREQICYRKFNIRKFARNYINCNYDKAPPIRISIPFIINIFNWCLQGDFLEVLRENAQRDNFVLRINSRKDNMIFRYAAG